MMRWQIWLLLFPVSIRETKFSLMSYIGGLRGVLWVCFFTVCFILLKWLLLE